MKKTKLNKTTNKIINYLQQKKIKEAILEITKTLTAINKSSYEPLVELAIKVDLLEKNMEFTTAKKIITELITDTYTYDIAKYLNKFFYLLGNKKYREAQVYLEILTRSKQYGIPCVLIDSLKKVLDQDIENNSMKKTKQTRKPQQPTKTISTKAIIRNFNKINNYILNSGLSINDACTKYGLNKEQIDIVILLYAKNYYISGNIAKGNEFLNAYEKSENKTSLSLNMYKVIKQNKQKYAENGNDLAATLSLNLSIK